MAPSTAQGKGLRLRRLPKRPREHSRTKRCGVAVTEDEKRKIGDMAKVYDVDESELLYFKSVSTLLRQHAELNGTETPDG